MPKRKDHGKHTAAMGHRWLRPVCRVIGHRWVWTGGWIEMDCARCGMTNDERRELLRAKGLIP